MAKYNIPFLGTDPELDKYLKDISKTQPLSWEEERELARRIKEGDKEARDELVEANLRFVVTIAKEYLNRGLPPSDLISEGNVGLLEAAKRFDGERGYKFISYAVWWVRQAIRLALAEQTRTVRIPLNRISLLSRIEKAVGSLGQELEEEPDIEEIAKEIGESPETIVRTLKEIRNVWSLDAGFSEEDERTLLDVIEDGSPRPDEFAEASTLRDDIEAALEGLNPQEREVIGLYFGLGDEGPLNLGQIGDRFGLTRERIRQIKVKALDKLRHPKRRRMLQPHLD